MTLTELTPSVSLTGRWKPYAAYKDSGVEWLGEIPEHWEVNRLKFIASEPLKYGANESAEMDDPNLPRYIRITDIREDGSLRNDTFKSLPEEIAEPYLLINGDLLFVRSGATVGKSILYKETWGKACYAGYLIRVRINPIISNPHFISYFVTSSAYQNWLSSVFIQATIQNVSAEKYANLHITVPSLPEQRAIVDFLDRETARINALIAKKERLIELLQEKRAALISHAVTKGLDSSVPMKDSGVEWLGEIPAHWKARQFKRVAEINYGLTLELDRTETEGTYIISLPNVTKEGQLLLNDVPLTPLTSEEKKKLLLRKGDLLFNWRNGSSDHVGKTAYFDANGEYTHVSFLLRIRFDSKRYDSRYYQMFLNNLRNTEFFSSAKNRVNKTYNQTELGRLEVMVPPFEEQRSIATYLDRETAKIDALISKIRVGIEKLREYSRALISAAVTGKIDVREENAYAD